MNKKLSKAQQERGFIEINYGDFMVNSLKVIGLAYEMK